MAIFPKTQHEILKLRFQATPVAQIADKACKKKPALNPFMASLWIGSGEGLAIKGFGDWGLSSGGSFWSSGRGRSHSSLQIDWIFFSRFNFPESAVKRAPIELISDCSWGPFLNTGRLKVISRKLQRSNHNSPDKPSKFKKWQTFSRSYSPWRISKYFCLQK